MTTSAQEWSDKNVQTGELKRMAQQINEFDASVKELQRKGQNFGHEESRIKDISRHFLEEFARQVDNIEAFFQKKLKELRKAREDIVLVVGKASDKKVKVSDLDKKVILDKMTDVLRKASLLQNFALTNFEQLRKLARLQDDSSAMTYEAKKFFEDKCKDTEFDDDQVFSEIQQSFVSSYAKLLDITEKKALLILQEKQDQPTENDDKQRAVSVVGSFLFGILVILLIALIDLVVYCNQGIGMKYKLSKVCDAAIRVNFIISTIMLGFGFDMLVWEYRKINYVFILNIPAKIVKYGHKSVIRLGCIHMIIVTICSSLCIISSTTFPAKEIPILFGQFAYYVGKLLLPTYWMVIPPCCLLLYTVQHQIRYRGQDCLFKYAMDVLFKMFTPWRQKVEFPYFFFCNLLNSAKETFKDIILIIGCNLVPDYILIIFQNTFNVIRGWQSYLRFRENNIFYSQGWNMVKYILSILPSMNNIAAVKANQVAYYVFTAFKALECLYKLYWDVCEDWGLFFGGASGKKFRNKKNQWKYGCYVRRPSQYKLISIIFLHAYDYFARLLWIGGYSESFTTKDQAWYKTLTPHIEIIRRLLWMVMRMDNQQATNAEDYAATKYIPVAIDTYEREKSEQKEQQDQNAQRLQELQELLGVFQGTEKMFSSLATMISSLQSQNFNSKKLKNPKLLRPFLVAQPIFQEGQILSKTTTNLGPIKKVRRSVLSNKLGDDQSQQQEEVKGETVENEEEQFKPINNLKLEDQ